MAILQWLLFILPAYVSNALPVLFSGRTPIDQGYAFADGSRFLGKGKTFRGFLAGVLGGTLVGAGLTGVREFLPGFSVQDKIAISFLLATGAMLGDAAGSFIKRRLGVAPGQKAVTDAMTFVLVALTLSMAAFPSLWPFLGYTGLGFLLVVTVVAHRLFNALAHRLELKRVPW